MKAHRGSRSVAPPVLNFRNKLRREINFLLALYTFPLEILKIKTPINPYPANVEKMVNS